VPSKNLSSPIHWRGPLLLPFFGLALTVFLSPVQSQQPSPPKAESSSLSPPLRVTTRLVQVNVIVNDKHGNPISGLTQKDFSVFDNGKLQAIQLFSAESNLPKSIALQPLPPGTFTNRPEEQANTPASVTVILFDSLNTDFADQALTRKQVLKFLGQLHPQEYVALYWLGNKLYLLNDFTTNVASIREALVRPKGESNREVAESNVDYLHTNSPNPSLPAGISKGQTYDREAFRAAFEQRVANESTKDRVRLTEAALIAIAHNLGARKGRKNLVWVSGSFPFTLGNEKFDLDWANDTGDTSSSQIARAAQALTDADVAVYPVDARGLMGTDASAAGDFSEAPPPEFSGEGNERLPTRAAPGNIETMKVLAERTGGKAFYGTNDISGALRRALDDSRVTYTLAYSPLGAKWDGRFHEIKIKVAAPAAEVRARSGYFALPDAPLASPRNDHAFFSQLTASPIPATGIGLHVRAQLAKDPATRLLTVSAQFDLREIAVQQKDGRWTGKVRSVFLQLDNVGRILKADDRTFFPEFDESTYERVLQTGISDTRQITLLPSATQLCIVVVDASSSRIGSIFVPLAQYFTNSSNPNRAIE